MPGPRRFLLQCDRDVTGVSGTGAVAEGVMFSDGTLAIRWLGDSPSTVAWARLEDAVKVHGHGGATRVVWLDEDPVRCVLIKPGDSLLIGGVDLPVDEEEREHFGDLMENLKDSLGIDHVAVFGGDITIGVEQGEPACRI